MIHAGTIRTGSGRTFGVAGAYWINSISSLRKTILPFAVATDLPTAKLGSGCGRPAIKGVQSSSQLCRPDMKFPPPDSMILRRIAGLLNGKLEGGMVSRHGRIAKSTIAAFDRDRPLTSVVARCHHC